MANLTVAAIGPNNPAKDLGKKGTVSDLALYDLKQGGDSVTFVEPVKYPERLAPLFYSVSLADRALLTVEAIDANLGESMVMLHVAGVRKGWIVLRNYISREQLEPLTKGTVLENYEYMEDDRNALRQAIMGDVAALNPEGDGPGAVSVDHFFNVKGVGTVVLGQVAYGRIRKHDELTALPTSKKAIVRSIQKHDDDHDEAVRGDRVGLALKNVDVDDLDRGMVLSADPRLRSVKDVTGTAEIVQFWKSPLKEGMVLHIGHWMQFVPARVVSVEGDARKPTLKLSLDAPIVHPPGSRAAIMHLDGGRLRVVGSMALP